MGRRELPPVAMLRCDCCTKYAYGLSKRGWCGECEREFVVVIASFRSRQAA